MERGYPTGSPNPYQRPGSIHESSSTGYSTVSPNSWHPYEYTSSNLREYEDSSTAATATERQELTILSPTIQGTAELLQQSQKQFIKSDESAFSIVPSRMSSRTSLSTNQTGDRDSIRSSESLVYRRFSFENDLFTARVYKRNYRTSKYQGPRKQKLDRDTETVTLPEDEQNRSDDIVRPGLPTWGGGYSYEISSEGYELRGEKLLSPPESGIRITTTMTVSRKQLNKASVFSTSQLYVHGWLHHRLLASDPYVRLVKACGIGDDNLVRRQLGIISPRLLSSYVSGSIYFCPIHAAVFSEDVEVLGILLRHAELENDIDLVLEKTIGGTETDCWRPLHIAAIKANFPMVRLLIEKGALIHAETGFGIQAVHLAAGTGSIEILAALIAAGANVHCRNDKGHQPMHLAARIGSIEILAALIAAGASVNCRDHEGRQPMHYLSEIQRPEAIQYLAEKGAEIDGVSYTSQTTPLGFACRNGIDANAKALLSLGALVTSPILDAALTVGPSVIVENLLISAASQKQGQGVMATSLCNFVSALSADSPDWMMYVPPSRKKTKLRLLLQHTDLLLKNRNGDIVLYGLFDVLWPQHGRISGVLFLENLLDSKALEKDEVRSIMRREERHFSANRKRDSSDASACSDQSSLSSQEKRALSANPERFSTSASASSGQSSLSSQGKESPVIRENGSTAASASLDCPPEQSPAISSSDALLPSEEDLPIEAATPREHNALNALIRHNADHQTEQ